MEKYARDVNDIVLDKSSVCLARSNSTIGTQIADEARHMISNDMTDIRNNEIAYSYTHCEQAMKECKFSPPARLFLSSKGDYGMRGFRAD